MSTPLLPTVLALISTTVFTTMNLTLNHIAFPSYLLPSLAPQGNPESNPTLLLRQWHLTYSRGHLIGPTTILLPTALLLYASFHSPAQLVTAYRLAAALTFLPFPYTAVWILPVNGRLYELVAQMERRLLKDGTGLGEEEKGEAVRLIERCLALSKMRAWMGVGALGMGWWCLLQLTEG